MSNTPIQVTTYLSQVLAQINYKLDKIEEKFETKLDRIQQDLTDLKVGQAKLEKKVDGLAKRIDNQEFVSRGVLIGLIVAILGGAAKLFGFVGNP